MTEHPAFYGSPRNAVEATARELSSIAAMLECLSEKMPAPSDRAVLDFLIVRVSDYLHALREAAGHRPEWGRRSSRPLCARQPRCAASSRGNGGGEGPGVTP